MQRKKTQLDVKEFSLIESLNNNNGRTSLNALAGLATITVGIICFLVGAYCVIENKEHSSELLLHSLGMTTLGTSMVITKKVTDKNDSSQVTE